MPSASFKSASASVFEGSTELEETSSRLNLGGLSNSAIGLSVYGPLLIELLLLLKDMSRPLLAGANVFTADAFRPIDGFRELSGLAASSNILPFRSFLHTNTSQSSYIADCCTQYFPKGVPITSASSKMRVGLIGMYNDMPSGDRIKYLLFSNQLVSSSKSESS